MRYAIISDVHGNMDALSAILEDIENFNVDKYIFVGDYCACFPYPNEVVDTIRSMENAVAVKGNEEDYLIDFSKQDQSTWTDGQFQALYWLYKNLDETNHLYLNGLPNIVTLNDGDIKITIAHKSSDIYGDVEYKEFSPQKVTEKYANCSNARTQILHDIQEFINSNSAFHSAAKPLSDGVYIFGHTHIQGHAQYENRTFINPGSCGLPLDGTSGAPYTLLNIKDNQIRITERRVQYDVSKLTLDLKSSSLYKGAPVWMGIVLHEIDTKFEYAISFLQFTEDYANKINDQVRPFSIKTWTDAFNLWRSKMNII